MSRPIAAVRPGTSGHLYPGGTGYRRWVYPLQGTGQAVVCAYCDRAGRQLPYTLSLACDNSRTGLRRSFRCGGGVQGYRIAKAGDTGRIRHFQVPAVPGCGVHDNYCRRRPPDASCFV